MKKLILDKVHYQAAGATEYTLAALTINYNTGITTITLRDQNNNGYSVQVDSIPNTTTEQAILALINNGVLAGTIGDV